MSDKKHICFIVSSPLTIKAFLVNHVNALCDIYNVSIIVNLIDGEVIENLNSKIKLINLSINRNINLLNDTLVLIKLIKLLKRSDYDLIHSVTPKAGMLAAIAGKITGIPIRIHIFTGQVWASRSGISRLLLKLADRVIVFLSTNILADSDSQMKFLINEKVVGHDKIRVLAEGSISGVDIVKFKPDETKREELRARFNIKHTDVIYLFVGRLKYDKGIMDLCAAFKWLSVTNNDVHLMLIGPDEENLLDKIKAIDIKEDRLHIIPYTNEPASYMSAADIFCLPSYREGFGSVIIEAAACGIPSIGSRIYGITDAISEDETGFLHAPGNIDEMKKLMKKLYVDSDKRKSMGRNARLRAERFFSSDYVTTAWLKYYSSLI